MFPFLDSRSSALILGPRLSVPISLALGPKNIARKNSWIKQITYLRLYLFKIKTLYIFIHSTLGSHLVGPRPQNIARTNSWIKQITYLRLYLFKIKTLYIFKIFKKLFRKGQATVSKINGKAFRRSRFFFIDDKRKGKNFMVKYIQ